MNLCVDEALKGIKCQRHTYFISYLVDIKRFFKGNLLVLQLAERSEDKKCTLHIEDIELVKIINYTKHSLKTACSHIDKNLNLGRYPNQCYY